MALYAIMPTAHAHMDKHALMGTGRGTAPPCRVHGSRTVQGTASSTTQQCSVAHSNSGVCSLRSSEGEQRKTEGLTMPLHQNCLGSSSTKLHKCLVGLNLMRARSGREGQERATKVREEGCEPDVVDQRGAYKQVNLETLDHL